MKIMLLGKDGRIGWELQRALAPLGQVLALSRADADLSDLEKVRTLVGNHEPNVVVNAAAYTSVDKAESEPWIVRRINTEAVGVLAEEIQRFGGWFIHYSTDYVFDGEKTDGAYLETDIAKPLSVYGKSKFDGEELIRSSGCHHLIFRTSWIHAIRGSNFAKSILRLAQQRTDLNVVSDQIGAPTSAELVADITAVCLHQLIQKSVDPNSFSGTYHLACKGETSWHRYAQLVISEAINCGMSLRARPNTVHPIRSDDYPSIAKRPANSRLDTAKLSNSFDLTLPHWEIQIKRLVAELVHQGAT